MKRLTWILLLIFCALPLSSNTSHAYDYNKNGSTPIRWPKGQPIAWYLNMGSFTKIPKAQVESVFKKAFDAWQKINCAQLTFVYRGFAPIAPSTKDNKNVIAFVPPSGGYIMSSSIGLDAKGNLADVDVLLNPTAAWSLTPRGNEQDLEGAAMYVVGLMISLRSSKVTGATMEGTFQATDISKRTLHPDDISGACFLYPNNKPQCAQDTDCPPGLGCTGSSCVLKPPTASANFCKLCATNTDCGPGMICDFLGGGSVCLHLCTPDTLCPTGQTCNGAGIDAQCFPTDGKCPVQRCQTDADCGGKYKCITGQCKDASTPTCAANSTRACQCPGGETGSQKCRSDGKVWESCVCGGPQICTPNATQACKCTTGNGSQTCNADGKAWGQCSCGSTGVCTAGATQACTCSDGKSGSQTCNADGKAWGQCTCSGGGNICAPGSTQACTCSDGKSGSQTCNADGKAWGQCTCGGGGNICAPGGTQACVCTDGKNGSQSCNADGKAWGQCTCGGGNTGVCNAGQTQPCSCPNGPSSTQTCSPDGSAWGACNCVGGPASCTPGQTQTCTCPTGLSGSQSCNTDGASWGQCTCQGGGGGCNCSTDSSSNNPFSPTLLVLFLLGCVALRIRRK